MNHKNYGNQGHRGMTATPAQEIKQMKMNYGYDDKGHVVVTFNQPAQNLLLTPAQCDEMIAAIEVCKEKLAEYVAGQPRG